MQYLLLLAGEPGSWDAGPGPHDDGVIDDWATYTRALETAGVLIDGAALHAPHAATTVRVRAGARLLTDGPFAETKEHLVGYYVIDAPDLDAALAWAARAPNARTGSVEVRPLRPGSRTSETLTVSTRAAS